VKAASPAGAGRHRRRAAGAGRRWGPAVGAGAILLATWEIVPPLFGLSELLLPRASSVAGALWTQLERGLILENLLVTLWEALSGFALGSVAGIVSAALITHVPLLERALMPYLVGLQALPKVALAPLLVVWLGFGLASKISIATIIAFFPVLINSMIGFSTVETEKLELMRSLVASEWQIFRIVRFPNALPFIFAGLNVAIVFSITGRWSVSSSAPRGGSGCCCCSTTSTWTSGGCSRC